MSTGYEEIESALSSWAQSEGVEIVAHSADSRSMYFWSGRGECFQIWVELPHQGLIAVHAGDTETQNDEEFRGHWRVAVPELLTGLRQARAQVQDWMDR